MESCLLDVPTTDLATFVASATLLVGVGLLAAFIPSPRAAKLDPVRALASN
jgi:ABC-type lipoprotein release transport system permease subunit